MSVSAKTIEQLRAAEQAYVTAAQAQLSLVNQVLDSIKVDGPIPVSVSKHGYCADASMNFEGEGIVALLYKLYPPMACVDVKGSSQSQKPLKYLRNEEERAAIRPIFPVLFKSSKNEVVARWWTELNGLDVELNVKHALQSEFAEMLQSSKYQSDSHGYMTGSVAFFPRALAAPEVRPASMVTWMQTWVDFGAAFEFSPAQQRFLVKLSGKLAAQAEVPGADAMRVLSLDDIGFPMDPSSDGGAMTNVFNEKQQQLVLKFARGQVSGVRASLDKQAEEFSAVQTWFAALFSKFSNLYENDYDVKKYIVHQVQKETGLDVSVRIMRARHGSVSVSPYFKGWDQFPDYTFLLSTDPKARCIKPQDIDVTYA